MDSIMEVTYQKVTAIAQFDTIRRGEDEGQVDHGDSNALEQQLEAVFKIAKHLDAMLLLDEADAFMEQRTSYHDTAL
ncbi:hypothetical protein AnigIFM63309_004231 [Aspergillus niger]|nr:hypothetical protein AnigIFM63309_004231 [Aspergillus niger]